MTGPDSICVHLNLNWHESVSVIIEIRGQTRSLKMIKLVGIQFKLHNIECFNIYILSFIAQIERR